MRNFWDKQTGFLWLVAVRKEGCNVAVGKVGDGQEWRHRWGLDWDRRRGLDWDLVDGGLSASLGHGRGSL